jgi:hypothetical protein
MSGYPVIILGAGATKACGGPLTDEILPAALNGQMAHDDRVTLVKDREKLLDLTRDFLKECFNVPVDKNQVLKEDCPSLPMVLSMLHRSIEQGLPIGKWKGESLVKAKRAIEYSIFAVIEAALMRANRKHLHHDLLKPLYQANISPVVVSLNYDVIVDNAMFFLSDRHHMAQPPDYGVRFSTQRYVDFCFGGMYGRLLKIHGSLNWLYCDKCGRLDLFVSNGMRTGKALEELYHEAPFDDAYSCWGTPCRNKGQCDGFVSPILITPTYVKDYENPHIKQVWAEAEKAMKQADRAIIIGYSLPTDDIEVALLLKRGLDHLPRQQITVVEYVAGDEAKLINQRMKIGDHPTGQRFRTLFGTDIDWQTTGFEGWLAEQKTNHQFPFNLV